jgi:hypothetical protein
MRIGCQFRANTGGWIMTVLGKLLVFVNLVFSVVVGGLVVVVFTARTNYADALGKEREYRKADQEAAKAKVTELVNVKAEYTAELAKAVAAQQKAEKDLQTVLGNYKNYTDKIAADLLDRDKADTTKQLAQAELASARKAEQEAIKRADAANNTIKDLVKEKSNLTNEAQTAKIGEKTALDNMFRLEQQYQKLAKEHAILVAGRSGPATTTALNQKNPPAEKIDGQVTQASSDLLKLSVGSDSGLKQGHTMELFRLGAKPVYLGTVRIISLEPKAAVAKPIDRLIGAPQIGDTVSSRIGS